MIDLKIEAQPNDETCGPTCLHAVYRYHGLNIPLEKLIQSIERSESGGTLAPLLGKHALQNGFKATIYVNNMDIFDPTWFKKSESHHEILLNKLKQQAQFKHKKQLSQASTAYQEFLLLGGNIRFKTLDVDTLKSYFNKNLPIITGLNATYLYRSTRESFTTDGVSYSDDISGSPCGHFVVLCGYNNKKRLIVVADPYKKNNLSQDVHSQENHYYSVSSKRLINSILLGVTTYDANLLILEPVESDKTAVS